MTATHPIRQHIDLVAFGQQVERGLSHADVGLDAHDRDLERKLLVRRGGGGEREPDLRYEHAEGRFVIYLR